MWDDDLVHVILGKVIYACGMSDLVLVILGKVIYACGMMILCM